jgi:hypothetical protein
MHQHLCSNCRAVITLDEGGKCQRNVDHEDELCEACALTQPGLKETILTEAADQGDLGDPGRPPRQRSRDRQPHLADQPPADSALPSAGSVAKRTPSPGIPLSANTPIRLGGLIPAQCGESSVGLFLRLRDRTSPSTRGGAELTLPSTPSPPQNPSVRHRACPGDTPT